MSQVGPLARNTAVKLGSELIGRAASLLLLILAGRSLGSDGFGLLSVALAAGFVLAQGADLGLQTVIVREVAALGDAARPHVRTALGLKVGLALPVVLAMGLVALSRSGPERLIFLLLGLNALAQTFLEFAAYVFRGRQRIEVEAWLLGGSRVLVAIAGGLALWGSAELAVLAGAISLATGIAAAVALAILGRAGWLAARLPDAGARRDLARALWRQALPLGVATFLSIAYTRAAILLLSLRLDSATVGHFSAAQRLVEPAQMLPASFLAALFPAYSQAWRRERREANRLALGGGALLAAAGVAVMAALWLLAPWLMPALFGPAFAPAVPLLRWLSPALVPMFVNYGLTHYLIARGRQHWLTGLIGLMLVLHAGLTWLLMPRWGAVAAAVGILVAEGALLLGCLAVLLLKDRRSAGTATPGQPAP